MDTELDGLLVHRIDYFKTRRVRSLSLTAFAALAAIGFVTFITRSISGPVEEASGGSAAVNQTLQAEMRERYKLLVEEDTGGALGN